MMTQTGSHEASEALGLWEPKRTLTLEAARKHSRRIKVFRIILLILSALLISLLIWQFARQNTAPEIKDNVNESVRMTNPRYSGRTDDGLPYFLTASQAVRTTNNDDFVELVKPVLHFFRDETAGESTIVAEAGTYDDINKVLNLRTQVDLNTDDGNNCVSTHARIFAQTKIVEGDEPIKCVGSFGTVNGNTFEIRDNYTVFVFKDGMSAVLEQENAVLANGEDDDSSPLNLGGNEDILVKAQTATYKGRTTLLNGDVDVRQGTSQIFSDTMDIFRAEADPNAEGSVTLGAVTRIEADGNFRYITPEDTVTGDRGVYERTTGIITVTGDVRVKQMGGNTARTDRLIYNVKTETIRFAGDCLGKQCQGRPSLTIRQ